MSSKTELKSPFVYRIAATFEIFTGIAIGFGRTENKFLSHFKGVHEIVNIFAGVSK